MERFVGDDLTCDQLELRSLKLDPIHREGEAALMRSRWFDYRQLHPAAATYLFAELYRRETKSFYAEVVDERSVEDCRAFAPDDIFFSRDLTAMWLARRFCDEHGYPYPFVLRFARDRFFSRTQHNFPRPNQLYGEELELDLKVAWAERRQRMIIHASHPHFKASAFKGEVAQAQHIKFVIDQIKARPAPWHKLIARLIHEDVLSAQISTSHFGATVTDVAEGHRSKFM
jgi:hypothetical protein